MYEDSAAIEGFVLLFVLVSCLYAGWFFGRCREAQIEWEEEQRLADAYEWAVRHGKMPPQ